MSDYLSEQNIFLAVLMGIIITFVIVVKVIIYYQNRNNVYKAVSGTIISVKCFNDQLYHTYPCQLIISFMDEKNKYHATTLDVDRTDNKGRLYRVNQNIKIKYLESDPNIIFIP